MALSSLGTAANSSLRCLPAWSAVLTDADKAAIGQGIANDGALGAILGGYSKGPTAVFATGTTHTNTVLDVLVAVAGGAPLAQIHVGDLVLKADIPPGTFVASITSGVALVLSKAATGGANGNIAFVRQNRVGFMGLDPRSGMLTVPNRGVLKVLPGDVVAIDPASGWPILVSAAAISRAGSLWVVT